MLEIKVMKFLDKEQEEYYDKMYKYMMMRRNMTEKDAREYIEARRKEDEQ